MSLVDIARVMQEPRVEHDDTQLVERTRRGDLAAFGELYDRYARLVRAVCGDATCDLAAAQDLAQEVFLTAFEQLGKLREPSRFGFWVVGIARKKVKEWRRRQTRDRLRFGGALDDTGTATNDGARERLSTLLELLAGLPEMERLALHAFYLSGQSAEAAAEALGLSRSGFYKLLNNARHCLAQRFRQTQEDSR